MLVLSRKSQESIRIGDSITVTIVRIKGNTVRIGIEAPDSVKIVRSELPDFRSAGTETAEVEVEAEPSEPYLVKQFRMRNPTLPKAEIEDLRPSSTTPPVCMQRSATPLSVPWPR
jgi:carbon storage regulator